MHVCLDVGYWEQQALAACLVFGDWPDEQPTQTLTATVPHPAPYVPGRFFERELPCLIEVLGQLDFVPLTIVVDGHVYLDPAGRPGLGMHLFNHLGGQTPVIGVAKSPLAGLTSAIEVLRGHSGRALHVTAIGMQADLAAARIEKMHGNFRIPTLLKLADRLSRGSVPGENEW